ncbi:MAG: glycosyltransferase family 39 protein [Caldilineaceae bacterium]|nr:glycosyltransferase family 39 protein [Caldilineaceae bacterium]
MPQQHDDKRRGTDWWERGIILIAILFVGVGAWWRLLYIQQVGLHVDEYVSLYAATRILDGGLPILPSGMFYGRGLLTSYLAAGAMALGGINAVIGRLPSVVMGALGIVVIFAMGRSEWNARVGLLAAVALALLAEAIDAAGRVRFYAQFMLWTMLTLWAAYRMTRRPEAGWRLPWLVVTFFTLALFTQEEMILLYPVIIVGLLLWNGIGVLAQAPVQFVIAGGAVAMLARFALERVGPIDAFDAIQTTKAYVGLFFAGQSAWDGFGPLFTDDLRPVWSILAVFAVAVALFVLLWRRRRLAALAPYHQATLYFALFFAAMWLAVLTVVGESWHEPRFMLFVEPNWLLLGAAGLVLIIDLVSESRIWRVAATSGAVGVFVWLMWPMAGDALKPLTVDYTAALEYVAQHRVPGDRVATPQPPACAWVMGTPCSYYARGLDYEPYVVRKNGHLVDRWTGALLLSSASDLRAAIRSERRIWLVVDRDRLANRYDAASLETIFEQFDVAHEVGSTLVFVADSLKPSPAYTVAQTAEPPLVLGPLHLVSWHATAPAAGEPFRLVLNWAQDGSLRDQISTSVQLVAADGRRISQADGPPGEGLILMRDVGKDPIPDRKLMYLPDDLADGWYRLEVVAYTPEGVLLGDPLPFQWFNVGAEAASLAEPARARWANGIGLNQIEQLPATLAPGMSLPVALEWRAAQRPSADLTAFVHLIGPDGSLVAQHDKAPLDGFYPTTGWTPETVLAESYMLHLPDTLAPGSYRLDVGWYDAATGERALTEEGDNAAILAEWTVP